MGRFLSGTFFKSFSSKYVYVEAATTVYGCSFSCISPVYTVQCTVHVPTLTCMWSAALNKRLYVVVHMLSYYEEDQTHPINVFQYSLLKYLLHCQFIKNISNLARWLHRCGDREGGWWPLVTQQADEQLNFEWYRQKLLAGKEKENSQIFNEDFYLPLYLPLCRA